MRKVDNREKKVGEFKLRYCEMSRSLIACHKYITYIIAADQRFQKVS